MPRCSPSGRRHEKSAQFSMSWAIGSASSRNLAAASFGLCCFGWLLLWIKPWPTASCSRVHGARVVLPTNTVPGMAAEDLVSIFSVWRPWRSFELMVRTTVLPPSQKGWPGWHMYAHYAMPSEHDPDTLQYHQYLYASTRVKSSYQEYKDGRAGLRSAQVYARAQSYALKAQLEEY